ncbi:MAG TPA: VOC family protein [Bryobacteraceae bacterium]|jgi:4-hydroxyphenylpyruvate dioxygenase-like putative hemolysin|nr:VOC family protein [Bryobacteraceae bacterium]
MSTPASAVSSLANNAQGIDHIAIAVPNLEESLRWFTDVLGFTLRERRKTEGKTTGMISAVLEAGPLQIVLLQGTDPQSQVSRFVAEYGPGVQHVAIRVGDVDGVSNGLRNSGLEFDTTVIDGGGLRQIFSRRDKGTGLMFEIIERNASGFSEQNVSALFAQLEEKNTF